MVKEDVMKQGRGRGGNRGGGEMSLAIKCVSIPICYMLVFLVIKLGLSENNVKPWPNRLTSQRKFANQNLRTDL